MLEIVLGNGMLHRSDCCGIVYNRGRHRLRQCHDYLICQAKEVAFSPKPKVVPIAKVLQDYNG